MPMMLKSVGYIISFRFIFYRRSSFWWNVTLFRSITDTPHHKGPVSHQIHLVASYF